MIKKYSEEKVFDVEGCLSFPGIFIKVERPKTVEVQYETTQGETKKWFKTYENHMPNEGQKDNFERSRNKTATEEIKMD